MAVGELPAVCSSPTTSSAITRKSCEPRGPGSEYFPTDHDLLVAEARALIVLGDEMSFEEVVAEVLSTPTGLTPANLLIEAAATARAHGRPDRARDLARRALIVLDDRADPNNAFFEGWVRAQALVLADELDQAQAVLETVRSMKDQGDHLPFARG